MTSPDRTDRTDDGVTIREAGIDDAPAIWRIVKDSGVLDVNSSYAYLLWCRHFGPSSVVAEHDGELVGFITAFRPPAQPDVAFVWQVAVDASMRGRSLARRMLHAVVRLPANEGTRFLETTVTPDNEPSRRLFRSFARHEGESDCTVSPYFTADQFPDGGHEPEELFRIGPFDVTRA